MGQRTDQEPAGARHLRQPETGERAEACIGAVYCHTQADRVQGG